MKRETIRLSLVFAATLSLLCTAIPAVASNGRIPLFGQTTISSPGSYYLTNDVVVGIVYAFTIASDNVTLDLNGHTVTVGSGGYGVYCSGYKSIRITNGSISGGSGGCTFRSAGTIQIDHVTFSGQSNYAVIVDGADASHPAQVILADNAVYGAGQSGIDLEYIAGSRIENNEVRACGAEGINVRNCLNSTFAHNIVSGNTLPGVLLDSASFSAILYNDVSGNGGAGLTFNNSDFACNGNKIAYNTFSKNGSDGLYEDSSFDDVSWNTCSGNSGYGVSFGLSYHTIYSCNRASGNTNGGYYLNNNVIDGGGNH
jgi:parallel beta-helix repeat protein